MKYLFCIIGGLLSVVGGVLFKYWAVSNKIPFLIAGVIAYSFDAIVWALLLKRGTDLSTGGVLWSAISLIISIFAGIMIYREQVSISQWFGVAFVLAGIVLLR